MRILYGICGEGMGHANRAKVVIEYLRRLGHEILIVVSGKAYPVMARFHPNTLEIIGLSMHCSEGALDLHESLAVNAQKLPNLLTRNADAWRRVEMFSPQAVVTDFDSFAWLFARSHELPVVSIDNAQVLPRCQHDRRVLTPYESGFRALESFTISKAPECHHYIITSFFYPPVKPNFIQTTTLVPPILSGDVLRVIASPPKQEAHPSGCVLVYKTNSLDDQTMLKTLDRVPAKFLVYGVSPNAVMPQNCINRPFDEKNFIQDLKASRAVVSNAGMSLTGEALALGKPIFAVPVREQYEQVLNACYLEHLGYGVNSQRLDPQLLTRFLERLPFYSARLRETPQHDANRRLYRTLDSLFGRA